MGPPSTGDGARPALTLRSPISFANTPRFPVQSFESRRDLWVGALWLLAVVAIPG